MNLSLGSSRQPGSVSGLDVARPLGERIIYIIMFLVPELLLFKAILQTSAGTACLPYLHNQPDIIILVSGISPAGRHAR
jgi:hypothetical protein